MASAALIQPRDRNGRWVSSKKRANLALMSPAEANNWISSGILYGTTAASAYKWYKKRKKKNKDEERKAARERYRTRKTVVVKKNKTKR